MPPHPPRLALEQGRPPPGLHPHGQGRPHRGQPGRPHPAHLQALRRPHGCVPASLLTSFGLLCSTLTRLGVSSSHRPQFSSCTASPSARSTAPRSFSRSSRCVSHAPASYRPLGTLETDPARSLASQNPITDHLPSQCHKISASLCSCSSPLLVVLTFPHPAALSFDAKPVRLRDYLPTIPDTHSICVFVGAMAHGCVPPELSSSASSVRATLTTCVCACSQARQLCRPPRRREGRHLGVLAQCECRVRQGASPPTSHVLEMPAVLTPCASRSSAARPRTCSASSRTSSLSSPSSLRSLPLPLAPRLAVPRRSVRTPCIRFVLLAPRPLSSSPLAHLDSLALALAFLPSLSLGLASLATPPYLSCAHALPPRSVSARLDPVPRLLLNVVTSSCPSLRPLQRRAVFLLCHYALPVQECVRERLVERSLKR